MTDIKLLPLPEPWGWARANNGMIEVSHGPECPHNRAGGYATPWGAMYGGDVLQDHARANVAHATAAKDAEIERLRAEVDRWKSNYNAAIELKGRAFAESDRLAEALRECISFLPDRGVPGMHKDTARAALRDHDKEGANDR